MQINNSQQQLRVQYSQIMQQGRLESTQGRTPQASPNGSMVAAEHNVSIANQTQSITSQPLGKSPNPNPSAVLGHMNLSLAMQSTAITSAVTMNASDATNLSQALDAVATLKTAPVADLVTQSANHTDDGEIDESQDEKPFNAMHSFQEVRQILASLQQSWATRLPARGQDEAIASLTSNDEMTPKPSAANEKLLPTQPPLMPPQRHQRTQPKPLRLHIVTEDEGRE
jgi:molybdopterin-binding protein